MLLPGRTPEEIAVPPRPAHIANEPLRIGWAPDERCTLEVRDDPEPSRMAAHVAGISAALLLVALTATPLAERVGVTASSWEGAPGLLRLLAMCAALGLIASVVVWLLLPRRHAPSRCAVEVDQGKLLLTAEGALLRTVPLSDIDSGWIEEPETVVVRTRARALHALEIPDETRRDALLAALGVSAAERVLVVPLASSTSQLPFGRTLGALLPAAGALAPALAAWWTWVRIEPLLQARALGRPTSALVFAALTAAALVCSLQLFRRLARFVGARSAVVGTDGIIVDEHTHRMRLAYADVAKVEPHERGVMIETRNGRRHTLATIAWNEPPLPHPLPPWAEKSEPWRRREALLRRVREALGLERARVASVKVDLLDRAGRSISAWRAALQMMAGRPVDYRGAEITREDLAAVAVDGCAAPERRIAAAYALASVEDEARSRVRIAAGACADEHLRAAIEEACEGEISDARLRRIGRW
jgi:hypothetical protein